MIARCAFHVRIPIMGAGTNSKRGFLMAMSAMFVVDCSLVYKKGRAIMYHLNLVAVDGFEPYTKRLMRSSEASRLHGHEEMIGLGVVSA